ncbi:MAG: AAA family ATPase [Acidimicrobiia bacterium]
MKLGIAGKGGSGKTTTSGTLARSIAALGHDVLAIDCDGSPNLGPTLGLAPEMFDSGRNLGHEILDHVDLHGETWMRLALPLEEILDAYAIEAPGNIRLLTMARATEPGGG